MLFRTYKLNQKKLTLDDFGYFNLLTNERHHIYRGPKLKSTSMNLVKKYQTLISVYCVESKRQLWLETPEKSYGFAFECKLRCGFGKHKNNIKIL